MNTQIKNQLKQSFKLLKKIREKYPGGDFDREMRHGEMNFPYPQVKDDWGTCALPYLYPL